MTTGIHDLISKSRLSITGWLFGAVKTMPGYYSARDVLWTGSSKPSPAASSPSGLPS